MADDQRDLLFIGIRKDLALVQSALDVIALRLLGEQHGNTVFLSADRGQSDAACLRC